MNSTNLDVVLSLDQPYLILVFPWSSHLSQFHSKGVKWAQSPKADLLLHIPRLCKVFFTFPAIPLSDLRIVHCKWNEVAVSYQLKNCQINYHMGSTQVHGVMLSLILVVPWYRFDGGYHKARLYHTTKLWLLLPQTGWYHTAHCGSYHRTQVGITLHVVITTNKMVSYSHIVVTATTGAMVSYYTTLW